SAARALSNVFFIIWPLYDAFYTVFIYSILGIVFIEINLKYPLLSNDSIPTKYGIIKGRFNEKNRSN
ncbi:TPA: hypothetical protein ACRGGI_005818, partial [Klebsiella pneumoniae]